VKTESFNQKMYPAFRSPSTSSVLPVEKQISSGYEHTVILNEKGEVYSLGMEVTDN
jgi:alpha-tubulin suppressor-like RCC1 family protein